MILSGLRHPSGERAHQPIVSDRPCSPPTLYLPLNPCPLSFHISPAILRLSSYLVFCSHPPPSGDDDEDDDFIPRGKPTATVSGGGKKGAGRP